MTKYAAFDTQLNIGTSQVETATIVCPTGAITGSGNIDVILTHDSMTGDPITTVVAVLITDTSAEVAGKIIAALNLDSDITDHMTITGTGPYIVARLYPAVANEGTLNISVAASGATGLTDDLTSVATVAGVAVVETAAVTNIGGPGLSLDTEDVTTHDSTGAWEEVVATILRSGEVSMDIIYDPADDTHDATDTGGLAYRLKNKVLSYFDLLFMGGANNWIFFGYVTGFEPTAPVGGALTATVKVKIAEAPTLE